MKRKWIAVFSLVITAMLLTSCAGGGNNTNGNTVFTEVTQYLGPVTVTDTPVPVDNNVSGVSDGASLDGTTDGTASDDTTSNDGSIFSENPYTDFTADDALSEEDYGVAETTNPSSDGAVVLSQADSANATVYPYAGSTPIPLDPVDAPTPTPRPQLTFTYVPYEVAALGVSFEAPAGWVPDESVSETYTLTEPEAQMKEGQLGVINIYAVPVASNYTVSNLTTEIKQRLNTIGATNFAKWSPSLTAERFLMGGKGVYANYSGTLVDGVEVGGRIHATCIDKVLYCIQITYPLGYKDDYLNIFAQVRTTLARLQ